MIKCPKCDHEFEDDEYLSPESMEALKSYQKAKFEYLKNLYNFTTDIENQSPPS